MEIKERSSLLPLPGLQPLAPHIERIKVADMISKGYRVYNIKTRFYRNHYAFLQKKLNLEIVIGGDNLLFIKTIPSKFYL
jgi:hypothetical protein